MNCENKQDYSHADALKYDRIDRTYETASFSIATKRDPRARTRITPKDIFQPLQPTWSLIFDVIERHDCVATVSKDHELCLSFGNQ